MAEQVLVTGSGGFIGSHLVHELVRQGTPVRAMVRYTSDSNDGQLRFLPEDVRASVEIVRGDIRDPSFVADAMRGCETVYHLAALIAIPYSYVAPHSYVETNIGGTLNVLEAARRFETTRVVHTSTSETYGTAVTVPMDEGHPLQGQSPYSATKIGADKLAESYYRSFGLPVVTVRPFNTFGPRQSARAVIPTIFTQALGGGPIRLGSLDPVRDLTFVLDTVSGFMAAGGAADVEGETINLGTGVGVSIGDVVHAIGEVLGRTLEVELDAQRIRPDKSEVFRLISDNSKARRLLGWSPAYSLDDGIRACVDWYTNHLADYDRSAYTV
ncbi:MAG TPA: SDR family NAD(P)-dependent oxidoreductase [Rubricoccaceae bacterium]|jgi:dTDP-glucose 4,6-dehydratase